MMSLMSSKLLKDCSAKGEDINMRFTKEEFVEVINSLKTAVRSLEELEKVLHTPLFDSPMQTLINEYTTFIKRMCDIPDNEADGSSLEYYIYELDFGTKYYHGCVIDVDGNNIPLGTPEELYDDLIIAYPYSK